MYRWIVEYLPASEVARIAKRFEKKLSKGFSLWDCYDLDTLTREIECRSEHDALTTALRVLSLDEFGEVHVFEQRTRSQTEWLEWETERKACIYEGDTELKWESYL